MENLQILGLSKALGGVEDSFGILIFGVAPTRDYLTFSFEAFGIFFTGFSYKNKTGKIEIRFKNKTVHQSNNFRYVFAGAKKKNVQILT